MIYLQEYYKDRDLIYICCCLLLTSAARPQNNNHRTPICTVLDVYRRSGALPTYKLVAHTARNATRARSGFRQYAPIFAVSPPTSFMQIYTRFFMPVYEAVFRVEVQNALGGVPTVFIS